VDVVDVRARAVVRAIERRYWRWSMGFLGVNGLLSFGAAAVWVADGRWWPLSVLLLGGAVASTVYGPRYVTRRWGFAVQAEAARRVYEEAGR
jgi:hypothetical protein